MGYRRLVRIIWLKITIDIHYLAYFKQICKLKLSGEFSYKVEIYFFLAFEMDVDRKPTEVPESQLFVYLHNLTFAKNVKKYKINYKTRGYSSYYSE